MTTVLIAETDRHTLDVLSPIFSSHITHITIDSCISVAGHSRKLKEPSFDTIAMSSRLVAHYRYLTTRNPAQAIAPLLVTASHVDRTLAYRAIKKRDAIDLIIQPIVPQEAAQSVKVALWQNKLLKLLASKVKASSRFLEHMEALPHPLQAKPEFVGKLTVYDRTYQSSSIGKRLVLNREDEQSLFDMASSLERLTRQWALYRLVTRFPEDPIE